MINKYGDSLLHTAVSFDSHNPALFELFIRHQADFSQQDAKGRTPEQLARYNHDDSLPPMLRKIFLRASSSMPARPAEPAPDAGMAP